MKYVKGNILESQCQAIVNTVNCVGVMGKGLAAQFKKAYPLMYRDYYKFCTEKRLSPGGLHFYQDDKKIIINFATKDHYRNKSEYEWIEAGLAKLADEILDRQITSIAVPPLGCGLGGLEWGKVQLMLVNWYKLLKNVEVEIYAP
jgi:O-acetyl-ADP-ribose deacetylase (regulator of RNase III)